MITCTITLTRYPRKILFLLFFVKQEFQRDTKVDVEVATNNMKTKEMLINVDVQDLLPKPHSEVKIIPGKVV